jgi:hypothetical protein
MMQGHLKVTHVLLLLLLLLLLPPLVKVADPGRQLRLCRVHVESILPCSRVLLELSLLLLLLLLLVGERRRRRRLLLL